MPLNNDRMRCKVCVSILFPLLGSLVLCFGGFICFDTVCEVIALFDVNEDIVGTDYNGFHVYHVNDLYDFCKTNNIHIGVLTVPKESAESVAKTLVDAGVRGLWNFANMELTVENSNVIVQNVHMGDSLMTLCFGIKSGGEKGIFDDQI